MKRAADSPVCGIDSALLAGVSQAAGSTPRRRRNHNFHPDDAFPAHRLLNAIEPGSYIVPHRHLDLQKDESIVCVAGRIGLVVFADDRSGVEARVLSPAGPCRGGDIGHGVYHTLVALLPGSVIFEAKSGPFVSLAAAERAPWAPAEGDPAAGAWLAALTRRLFAAR